MVVMIVTVVGVVVGGGVGHVALLSPDLEVFRWDRCGLRTCYVPP